MRRVILQRGGQNQCWCFGFGIEPGCQLVIMMSPFDLNIVCYQIRYKSILNMLKNRHTISSIKVNKRSIRPSSSSTYQTKPARISGPIPHIISSLEKNVKDLKTYYQNRQEPKNNNIHQTRSKTNLRFKKVLRRNTSQANLRPQEQGRNKGESINHVDHSDKTFADVFEIRSFFLKIHGRQTNNIVQLYEFYKKNVEKREKSTRILASIDMSNPNMGLSLDVGKQSLLKQSMLNNRQYRNFIKEEQSRENQKFESSDRQQFSSKLQNTSNLHKTSKISEKPSNLANDLLKKGLYDMANVTNLIMNKKYKLTKEKEQSFQMAKEKRQRLKEVKIEDPKQNNANFANTHFKSEDDIKKELNEMKSILEKQKTVEIKSGEKSNSDELDKNFSFDEAIVMNPSPLVSSKSHKKSKESSGVKPFEVSSIKKLQKSSKIDDISELEASPIVPKSKDFTKSKFYVQPIPFPNRKVQKNQNSISLQATSRIIDVDLLPFDL